MSPAVGIGQALLHGFAIDSVSGLLLGFSPSCIWKRNEDNNDSHHKLHLVVANMLNISLNHERFRDYSLFTHKFST